MRWVFWCSANSGSSSAQSSSLIVKRRPVDGTGLVVGRVLCLAVFITADAATKAGYSDRP